MRAKLAFAVALSFLGVTLAVTPALAQKQGGTLRIYHRDNLPSGSIHEEATISTVQPFMAVFNNLVMFDQGKKLNSTETIVPDLAESWAWDDYQHQAHLQAAPGRELARRQAVHGQGRAVHLEQADGQGHRRRLPRNPRAIWWQNVKEVAVNGDYEATFVLGRPQPSLLNMLASGYTPVYPCHVPTQAMRTNPIGTGPFKFVEFKRGDFVKFVRNPDYWKKGRPYVDAIEWKVIENRSTRILAFVAGEFDMTFSADVSVPLLKDVTAAGAEGHLRAGPHRRFDQSDHQPVGPALQRCQGAAGPGPDARSQVHHRYHQPGQARALGRHAAAAGRAMGHAAGRTREASGL